MFWVYYKFNLNEFILIGTHPTCDESTLFREITGQCNNLLEDRTLWGSMTISMRREIPAIDDLYQIATYNDLLIADRQGNAIRYWVFIRNACMNILGIVFLL